ncbi:MAG: hypothetical protein PHY47_27415 [Lachnospiraceae bacterium]|nr:hypothetical protein [Lachnospiraceae bacterium]
MKKKLHKRDKEIRKYHQKAISYCLMDLKDINNLAIVSRIVQEMWMQEKSQEPNQRLPGG